MASVSVAIADSAPASDLLPNLVGNPDFEVDIAGVTTEGARALTFTRETPGLYGAAALRAVRTSAQATATGSVRVGLAFSEQPVEGRIYSGLVTVRNDGSVNQTVGMTIVARSSVTGVLDVLSGSQPSINLAPGETGVVNMLGRMPYVPGGGQWINGILRVASNIATIGDSISFLIDSAVVYGFPIAQAYDPTGPRISRNLTSRTLGLGRTTTDDAPAVDAPARTASYFRPVSDVAGSSDANTRRLALGRLLVDAALASDVTARRFTVGRALADPAPAVDVSSRVAARGRSVADQARALDLPSVYRIVRRATFDLAPADGYVGFRRFTMRAVADQAPTTDAATAVVHPFRSAWHLTYTSPPGTIDSTNPAHVGLQPARIRTP